MQMIVQLVPAIDKTKEYGPSVKGQLTDIQQCEKSLL